MVDPSSGHLSPHPIRCSNYMAPGEFQNGRRATDRREGRREGGPLEANNFFVPCLAPNLVVMHLVERETVVCLDESVISRSLVRIRLRRFRNFASFCLTGEV